MKAVESVCLVSPAPALSVMAAVAIGCDQIFQQKSQFDIKLTEKSFDKKMVSRMYKYISPFIDALSCSCPPNSDNAKGRLPKLTAWYEGVNTPDLFVLGTAAHSRDYRSSAGGFVHGFRYTGEAPHVSP